MRWQLPAGRRRLKGDVPFAGQDQRSGEGPEEQQGGPGRASSVFPPKEGAKADNQKDYEKTESEVAGKTCKGPDVGCDGGGIEHDAGTSLALTLALAWPLAVCAFGPQTAGWKHIAVAGGYWCALFGLSFWVARRWGAESGMLARTAFRESRLAIATVGFAAVAFGSPVLLAIALDILAVAIAMAGYADGMAVGSSRHRRGLVAAALPSAPAEGRQ